MCCSIFSRSQPVVQEKPLVVSKDSSFNKMVDVAKKVGLVASFFYGWIAGGYFAARLLTETVFSSMPGVACALASKALDKVSENKTRLTESGLSSTVARGFFGGIWWLTLQVTVIQVLSFASAFARR